ncbi:MAG: radical SAM protein [Polyangiaceae bacterium]
MHRLAPGPRFRQREPKNVVAEMSELYHERGVRQFVFHDDNFLVPSPKENAYRLGLYEEALREAKLDGIGIVMKCGPQDLDEGALQKLVELGLLRIFLGIESGSQCGLDSIGRRQTCSDTERAVSLCEKYGVSSQYTMIIFNPDATVASMLADLDFVERHPSHPLNYCRAEIYAGTPLERRMLAAGAAEGTYMARTYRYADPKVARIWDLGRDLFAGRCWGEDELLGHAIRLDHQATVLRHFYEGADVQALVGDFYDWERRLNLETAGFFRELVLACDAARDDDAKELHAAIADLRSRELAARAAQRAELCDLRRRISDFVQPVIDHASAARNARLGFEETPVATVPAKKSLPRHAMAVVVAALMGCGTRPDNGVMEAPPPPLETVYTGGRPTSTGEPVAPPPSFASPPPSAPPTASTPPTASAPPKASAHPSAVVTASTKPPPPPPPIPTWMKPDEGVAEAAPPPLRPGQF